MATTAKKSTTAKAPATASTGSKRKASTAKKATTAPAKAKAPKSKLAQASAKGEVKFYRQRANGTCRRLPYLAPGTETRQQAEQVAARRSKGETLLTIADSLNVSKATVRRLETGLLLAQAIEAGEHDQAWDGKPGELILETTAS
jgi:hypothetical protein